ncbi:MAG: hypothetical protein ACRC6E_04250 [Fusobacteriaceae bacterium]
MNTLNKTEIQDFVDYLRFTGYTFEVEEKGDKYKKLIILLDGHFLPNTHYYNIEKKWGCQCRLYFYNFEKLPDAIKKKLVSSYNYGGPKGSRGPYTLRISDNDFIFKLVKDHGFRVGAYKK